MVYIVLRDAGTKIRVFYNKKDAEKYSSDIVREYGIPTEIGEIKIVFPLYY